MGASKARQLKEIALEVCPDAVLIFSSEDGLVGANKTARTVFRLQDTTVLERPADIQNYIRNGQELAQHIDAGLRGTVFKGSVRFSSGARELSGELHVTPIKQNRTDGGETWCLAFFRDLSSYNRLKSRMTHDEFYDRSTGLMNRNTLGIVLELELEKAEHDKQDARLSLMMVMIRNIEQLRALYTEDVLSKMVEHVANNIQSVLRPEDRVFRYDENRFLCLISRFKLKTDLPIIAEKIDEQISLPFYPKTSEIHLRSEIGISIYPEDGTTSDQLIGSCSSALTTAHERSLPWLINNSAIHQQALDRLFIRSGISRAINEKQLQLRYMALVDERGRICGAEALIRWNHPERGLLSPDQFLPVAIHSRIIGAITRWVLYRVVEDTISTFRDLGCFVSFNLSAIDLSDPFLPEAVAAAVKDRIDPDLLKAEITESECMEDVKASLAAIESLSGLGIDVMIDDFGTGHSSLSYLKEFRAGWVKVDRTFLIHVEESEKERQFLRHIIALAKIRGFKIILEGIETEGQFEILKQVGADLYQGHYFGTPMTIDELVTRFGSTTKTNSSAMLAE